MKSSKDTSSNTPFLSAAKITFYSFLPPLILRIWTEIHLLESISWEQQAWSTPLAWRRSAQTVIPWQSSFQPKPNVQPAYKKKFLFTSSCNTKSVPRRWGNFRKKTQNNPQRLTVGIYLGWHQWDCLRGKETFCALNVYLLCSSSKLGVYPFKQRQEPIHLFLPDCPCFFWHAIPWKWLQWSAVGGPGGLLKQVEAFVSQGKRK